MLRNLAAGTLKARMPVEQAAGADRRNVTHLEAFGRLLAGLAPWIDMAPDDTPEGRVRVEYADLARRALARAVDPASPDFMNFTRERQPLVDAAFLAQGLLRAKRALRDALDPTTKRQLVAALESTRAIAPPFNNWLLFAATVEAALAALGAPWDRVRVDYALRQHDQWYKGDGALRRRSVVSLGLLQQLRDSPDADRRARRRVGTRCRRGRSSTGACASARARYAAIQERLISPEGTFPAIGRSLAYRFGAFHLLAQAALRRALPEGVAPAQVRGALTSVIRRSCRRTGHLRRRRLAEDWILRPATRRRRDATSPPAASICAPSACCRSGLPPSDEFWSAPSQPWTSARAWSGQAFPIDHALAT